MNDKHTAIHAAIKGGLAILDIYENDFDVYEKDDSSPLTKADLNAHAAIAEELSHTNIPILSEEGREIPYAERAQWTRFWMVDPLDGTKEFVKRNGEFTVNIALIENGNPTFGVIYVPVEKTLYVGDTEDGALKYTGIQSVADFKNANGQSLPNAPKRDHLVVVGSRSHMSPETKAYIDKRASSSDAPKTAPEIISRGSSLKLCMVAEGTADLYPRFAPTMEWDTAAGDAICRASGCQVLQYPSLEPVVYNKKDLLNPWFLVERTGG